MRSLAIIALLLLAAIALPGIGPARADALSDRLAALAQDAVTGDGVIGIVVGVELSGAPAVFASAGLANVEGHVPMAIDNRFKLASIAKTFLAALVLKLEEEHRLTLDDKLSLYVPDIPNADKVNLRQLLNHTSGYDDYFTDAFVAAVKAAPGKQWSARELIHFARPEHLRFEPGSRYDYSNTNYLLIGLAAEAAAKEPLETALRHRFLQPLNLANSWIGAADKMPLDKLAHGYADTDDTGVKHDVTEQNYALGGADRTMLSNVGDLVLWCRDLFERHILAQKEQAEMLTFVAPADEDASPGAGYGLGVERFRVDGVEFIGHTGSRAGYNSVMLYQPARHAVIVIALNEDPTDEALLDILMERAVKAVEASGLLRFPRLPEAEATPASEPAPRAQAAPRPQAPAKPIPKPPQPPTKG
jgi:D-alanyl-D-alanine carboxypeptidase